MSNYLAIATVTSALRRLIHVGLQNATWNFSYDFAVTTTPPDVARSPSLEALGQINVFLYHVGPNAAWRNEPLPQQGFPSLALDLRYLLTAYAPDNDGIEAHRILGRSLGVLHDHAVLSGAELAAALENSDVHQQVERIRLTPLTTAVEEMSSLWSSFQKPYNLSVAWQASVVLIESTRAARAPLPALTRGGTGASSAENGVVVMPQIGPVAPGIDWVAPPARQTSVRLGETLKIGGHLLAGAHVRLVVNQSRWTSSAYLEPASVTARDVSVAIPSGGSAEADWPAGPYSISVGVTRELGEPEFVTNELPFTLAPAIVSITPAAGTVTAQVSPKVWPGQRVSLIVGERLVKPEPFAAKTDTLQFSLDGLSPGKYRLRLRVDGVDSLVVDKTTTPPSFVGPELEVS